MNSNAAQVTAIGSQAGQFLEVMAALGLVLGLAYLVLKFGLARMTGFKPVAGGPLELVARFPLEPRKTLYIVKAGTELVLIGSSEAQLQLLAGLSQDNAASILAELPAPAERVSFTRFLQAGLRKKDGRP